MSAEADIRALLDERVAAMRDKNAARMVATLGPDIVAFELAPPLSLSAASARDLAGLEAWFAGWEGPIEVVLHGLVVRTAGDIAFSYSLNRLRGTRTGGVSVDFWMRSTLGFERINGAWLIVHGHTSVPFLMDGSFRAAMDLKP